MEIRLPCLILFFSLLLPSSVSLAQKVSLVDRAKKKEESSSLTIFQQDETKIVYTEDSDRYHLESPDAHFSTPRFHYEDFKESIAGHVPDNELGKIRARLDRHNMLQRISDPSDEELMENALASRDLALEIIDHGQSFPCGQMPGQQKTLKGPKRFDIRLSEDQAKNLDQELKRKIMKENTFMGLGELTGMEVEFETGNDNFLLGGGSALGIVDHAEGIEGDDRGKTFNQDLDLAFVFDEGEMKLTTSATGYGKKVGVEKENKPPKTLKSAGSGGSVKIGEDSYPVTTKEYRDEDGKYYQHFLSVDGVTLEIKRNIHLGNEDAEENDGKQLYVRVVGTREEFDDQDGLAKKIQEKWHSSFSKYSDSSVEYNYLDHMDSYTRYSAKVELGQETVIKENEDYRISADTAMGVQLSNRDSAREASMRGELKLATADGGKDNRYPTWEGRVYVDSRMNRNHEESIYTGGEITRRFRITDNTNVSFSGGMSYENDPLSREYASEELKDNDGNLDAYHTLKLRLEHKF